MLSISNKDVLDYCKAASNALNAVVNFVYSESAHTIVATDATTYPSGDSRKIVNIDVYDYFGGHLAASILTATTGGAVTIDVSGLNNSRGFACQAIVVSTKHAVKDGTQFKISNTVNSGSFVMEH